MARTSSGDIIDRSLAWKTRGQSSPKGKPKVYFCCHPDDFDLYFPGISDDLLAKQNCAVWYCRDRSASSDATFFLTLSEMNLFVIPVTTKLLSTRSRAMDDEYPYAVRHHIPVLPLMQESGLDALYAMRFKDLHYLSKLPDGKSAASLDYDQKLNKYLTSVLIGDDMAAEIRKAFRGYIFLSYRKKDRIHARDLMKRIHALADCLDVAIWYDEFLVPGEGFNATIAQAIAKSNLFALVVTPNLINEQNYVILHEYPMAQQLQKLVLPAEMVETSKDALYETFAHLPSPVNPQDTKALAAALRRMIDALPRADTSDQHRNYLIGLAFLGGVDMEIDHEKALSLIDGSASAGHTSAMKKLVSMYSGGDGVNRDYQASVRWRQKLTLAVRKRYEETADPNDAIAYCMQAWELAEAQFDLKNYPETKKTCAELGAFCRDVYPNAGLDALRAGAISAADAAFDEFYALSLNTLGQVAIAENDLERAREYLQKDLDICRRLARATGNVNLYRNMTISYNLLGDVYKAMGDQTEATQYYTEALTIRQAQSNGSEASQSDIASSYEKLGDVAMERGDVLTAERYAKLGLDIRARLTEQTDDATALSNLAASHARLGDLAMLRERLVRAEECYQAQLQCANKLMEKAPTLNASRILLVSFAKLGDLEEKKGNAQSAQQYYDKELVLSKRLAQETDTEEAYKDLAVTYNELGRKALNADDLRKASGYAREAREICQKLTYSSPTIQHRNDMANCLLLEGDVLSKEGRTDAADELYHKALVQLRALVLETKAVGTREDVSGCLSRLGAHVTAAGRVVEARETFQEQLVLTEKIAKELDTAQAWDNHAVTLYNLATVDAAHLNVDAETLQESQTLLRRLAERFPDNADCKAHLALVESVLAAAVRLNMKKQTKKEESDMIQFHRKSGSGVMQAFDDAVLAFRKNPSKQAGDALLEATKMAFRQNEVIWVYGAKIGESSCTLHTFESGGKLYSMFFTSRDRALELLGEDEILSMYITEYIRGVASNPKTDAVIVNQNNNEQVQAILATDVLRGW